MRMDMMTGEPVHAGPAAVPTVPDEAGVLAVERRITVSALLTGRAPQPQDRQPQGRQRQGRRRAGDRVMDLVRGRGECAAVQPLLAVFAQRHPGAHEETEWLRRSYQVADFLHSGQLRKSGTPYISHPLAVATILAELGMDAPTLVAALLHDTVEDTDYTLGECRVDFGPDIARLVDGVTKLDGARLGSKARAEGETYRKMVLAAGVDLRVLLIKLTDRLHNLRTLGAQAPHKQARIARQSMELLVPFCERLGLYRMKREMEDLSFAYLEPAAHAATVAAVTAGGPAWRAYFTPLLAQLSDALRGQRLRASVAVRMRHLHSLHQAHGDQLERLRPGQVSRVVIVVEGSEQDCWVALGAVHQRFTPVPGRFRDHVSAPKYNLYQSVHTSVVGPDGEQIAVLIRTAAMQEVAEDGIAATIRTAGREQGPTASEAPARHRGDLEWLQQLLSWESHTPSEEYLDELSGELRGGSMVVVGSTGELVTLPQGATGVDFAYAVGVGAHLVGVRINGRLAPTTARLSAGDEVELISAPRDEADPAWLRAARTVRARRGIRATLAGQRTERHDQIGDQRPGQAGPR